MHWILELKGNGLVEMNTEWCHLSADWVSAKTRITIDKERQSELKCGISDLIEDRRVKFNWISNCCRLELKIESVGLGNFEVIVELCPSTIDNDLLTVAGKTDLISLEKFEKEIKAKDSKG